MKIFRLWDLGFCSVGVAMQAQRDTSILEDDHMMLRVISSQNYRDRDRRLAIVEPFTRPVT